MALLAKSIQVITLLSCMQAGALIQSVGSGYCSHWERTAAATLWAGPVGQFNVLLSLPYLNVQ